MAAKQKGALVIRPGRDWQWLIAGVVFLAGGIVALVLAERADMHDEARIPVRILGGLGAGMGALALLGWGWRVFATERLIIQRDCLELVKPLTGKVVGNIPFQNIDKVETGSRIQQNGAEIWYIGIKVVTRRDPDTWWPLDARSASEYDYAILDGFSVPLIELRKLISKRLRKFQGVGD